MISYYNFFTKDGKGVSPVIATVLLISMTIVIALIVFLWFRGITGEVITKFEGQNVKVVCGDVEFSAEYVNEELLISNTGNVPIFSMKVKMEGGGGHQTKDLRDIDNSMGNSLWPGFGLDQGDSFDSGNIGIEIGNSEKLTIIPVLLGTSKKGERTHVCDDKQFGYEIFI